ncbi:unnamed protein product (macronuclear) [Paramecium tetraurelia]|uniref:F-box domain-containing protein n=1 Tax=Paramecium tetraurelia TaxID=5888 RepID=A0BLZ3_PARTE|nr:uncharacterized protein GSPATT00030194001 [Paramecium tetraurelia]CAK59560.1 unnamed protein product [Paramecium tetraurelia]|eukprot:XP_001426958.1 hypothetical protein (macronuclear) [Paramecium tetraurelia strain d4-2]
MNQISKKIRKTRVKKKCIVESSKVVFCKIFAFLTPKEKLMCRFVCRMFNYYSIQSIESLNFQAQNTKMKAFKPFIAKCTNLKYLIYPCLYKRVQMTSLVGKKKRPQIREITHLCFRSYEDIADLMKLNTGLRALELKFDFRGTNNPQISQEVQEILLNSSIEEIIIKEQQISDLALIELMKHKITCIKLEVRNDQNQLIEKLISIELKLKKLYLKITIVDARIVETLNFFLQQQLDLEVLYLDFKKGVDLTNHKKLKTILLENAFDLKSSMKFPTVLVDKLIIKSLTITHKDIKVFYFIN